jgi:nucleotide-binding universal stress UspA family protein
VNSPLRILVATDGSDTAQHAVAWAAEFAQATGAEVILVHAMSQSGEWLMSIGQIDFVHIEAERRESLEGVWSEALRKADVSYRTRFLVGDPVGLLLRAADEDDVDAVVIGKAGHGALGSAFLGGSAGKLTHRTTRPLLIVPPASA